MCIAGILYWGEGVSTPVLKEIPGSKRAVWEQRRGSPRLEGGSTGHWWLEVGDTPGLFRGPSHMG